ncbi:hypothetical protein PUN28_020336 [Cardiocondyla obscurior]|uniref:Uncharacterized protein n=1 Tax=Cardiocondyla obscurior TaxID=286306 RepID=A0AAW2E7Y8_9HYME
MQPASNKKKRNSLALLLREIFHIFRNTLIVNISVHRRRRGLIESSFSRACKPASNKKKRNSLALLVREIFHILRKTLIVNISVHRRRRGLIESSF